jgi:Trypsin
MKFNINKKWLYAAALFGGIALAGMGVYSTYTSEDEVATAGNGETAQAANGVNAAAKEPAGALDKLQAWTSGWGFTPFGGVKGVGGTDEPAPILNGNDDPEEARPYEVMLTMTKPGQQGTKSCSGIVIAPQVILTAAHCLVDICPKPTLNNPRYAECEHQAHQRNWFVIKNTQGSIDLQGSLGDIKSINPYHKYQIPAIVHDSDNDIGIVITSIPVYSRASAIGRFLLNFYSDDKKYAKLDDLADRTKKIEARIAGYGASSIVSGGSFGVFKSAYVSTSANYEDDRNYIIDNFFLFSRANYGEHIYAFRDSFMRSITSMAHVTMGNTPATYYGDSGGGISHAKAPYRYFGINAATSFTADTMQRALNRPIYEFYAPIGLRRIWIEDVMTAEGFYFTPNKDLRDGNCFPNWPDTKPRNPKTKKCDTRTSDTQDQSDKNNGNGIADNNSGLGNNPLAQCTPADLHRMAEWNRTHSTAYLRAQAEAAWQQRYDAEYNRLLMIASNGTGSLDSITDYGIRYSLTARAIMATGPKPDTSNIRGTQIDLTACINNVAKIHIPMSNIYEEGSSCQRKYLEWVMQGYLEGAHRRATIAERNNWELNPSNYINRPTTFPANPAQPRLFDYMTDNTIQEFASFTPECRTIDYSRYKKYLEDITPECKYPCFKPRPNMELFNRKIDGRFLFDIIGGWLMSLNYNNSNTGNLNLINSTEGTKYSDGTQTHRFEWSTPNGSVVTWCIVPAATVLLGGGAIGTWGALNCRP